MEKANQAYEEAAKAAELAVKKAQDAAAETQESGKGIWQKARTLSLPASEFCFARTVTIRRHQIQSSSCKCLVLLPCSYSIFMKASDVGDKLASAAGFSQQR